ncbi:hydroxyacylglutathione hydrolase [Vibrio sp. 10N.286.49.C2]|uniref:hydroxyacylglutathione hydrolase n=1 Tax=unclassified Vibrio TaxID=2614977 RepID=UPI000C864B3D|nr:MULTISPECIES: hydroxyacylglutathione hydrolase [unclassified Vibrio]PMH36336.1 hydroxyacylglutathione hydrolase [Vibrio sp. 10N.286.49.C2]PMH53452.1 hydroxyacylglutathione hydrolase [Vibrio sp. 10N.286.49.B1]PMH82853.1 hydroxyacylglutathione hydrolase [Vibrio sp. 10N.286.48.B7]
MLHIKSIPAFNDNYIWLIQNNQKLCAVVDPGDAEPVIAYLEQHQLELTTILVTHHHWDHVNGIGALVAKYPNLTVIGPENPNILHLTHQVSEGHRIQLFGEEFLVLDLPGHTLDHIGYVGDAKLFCGDVLFSAGCGRIFEGTPAQMFNSLQKLTLLPEETDVYCTHEYTLSNLAFAMAIEPHNDFLHDYREQANQKRVQGLPTLPTSILIEKRINPFLRTQQQEVMKSVANRSINNDPVSTFTALREWKNEF